MSVLLETFNRRLFSPTEMFGGGRFRHPCMAGCGNVMVVPDPCTEGAPERLEEGQIWGCIKCGGLHEYALALIPGVRSAQVRLLKGVDVRGSEDPTVQEFMEAVK